MDLTVAVAVHSNFDEISSFYRTRLPNGYVLDPSDTFVVAWIRGEIVGSVRLVREHGVRVLRAMQVREDCQRKGIGLRLIQALVAKLGDEECYCIPYGHLECFYGLVGFQSVSDTAAPAFLRERLARYRLTNNSILMRRPGVV